MTPQNLIWKELRQRPTSVMTCLLAISMGISALVAIHSVTEFSENAIAQQLESLGANVLLLPQDASLQDYYAADLNEKTLPEEHAVRLAMANLEGVEGISPRLCVPVELRGRKVTLTGILPQSEFQAQSSWQNGAMFSNKHVGCKKKACLDKPSDSPTESLARQRLVQKLNANEVVIGSDVVEFLGIGVNQRFTMLESSFTIVGVLPPSGTVDDSRVFAHLHTVQKVAGKGATVNAIELTACCKDAAGTLVPKLNKMFDDAKVVTISHVVETQVSVNRMMTKLSYVFLGILVVLSAASVAGTMYSNVRERRREIGTLIALGATRSWVSRLFLGKGLLVGVTGGVAGFLIGTTIAVAVGPFLIGVAIRPLPSLAGLSVVLAGMIALVASYFPARRAAQIDPCLCFREV